MWLRHLAVPILLSFLLLVRADDCSGKTNNNNLPVEAVLKWKRTVPHGKLYTLGEGNEIILVAVIRGTPKEQGMAFGQLTAEELKYDIEGVLELCRQKVLHYGEGLPTFIQNFLLWLVKPLMRFALNLTWLFTRNYTPQRYFEELQGMAEGSGIEYMELVRMNMFPELIKAACSLVGVWGDSAVGGNVYFLRAFDWDTAAPVTKNPVITVYHNDDPNSYTYATFGYVGLVGAFTALNEKGLAIGEKYWYQPLDGDIDMSVAGKPWNYVIRDVAQFSYTLADAIKSLNDTKRTCAVHLGIATSYDNSYRGIRYSYDRLNVYDDNDYPQKDEKHPLIKGVNYVDKGVQPTKSSCMATLLKEKLRTEKIDLKFLYSVLAARHQTGDAQLLALNMGAMEMYFAYSTYATKKMAYDKPMYHMNLNDLFNKE